MSYPEQMKLVFSRWDYPREDQEYEEMVGKDLLFFDEHHGSARLLKNAELEDISRLDDDKTSIVVL